MLTLGNYRNGFNSVNPEQKLAFLQHKIAKKVKVKAKKVKVKKSKKLARMKVS